MARRILLFFLPLVTVSCLPSNVPQDLTFEHHAKRQYEPPSPPDGYVPPEMRAQAVVDAFRVSWDGYYEYAFPLDELKPVTNGSSNSRYIAIQIYLHTKS
jgi:mannosyl-oligosaccharide alpha-1,2-mannosidase